MDTPLSSRVIDLENDSILIYPRISRVCDEVGCITPRDENRVEELRTMITKNVFFVLFEKPLDVITFLSQIPEHDKTNSTIYLLDKHIDDVSVITLTKGYEINYFHLDHWNDHVYTLLETLDSSKIYIIGHGSPVILRDEPHIPHQTHIFRLALNNLPAEKYLI